jgi:predicted AlkP superfamily pyrophosphatase or phosphodiesterase
MSLIHRVWRGLATMILLVLSIHFTMSAFFKQKHNLEQKTEPATHRSTTKQKVILLLFDALREDFVEVPDGFNRYLDLDRPTAYKGRKL